jgi:hypothetical protein
MVVILLTYLLIHFHICNIRGIEPGTMEINHLKTGADQIPKRRVCKI